MEVSIKKEAIKLMLNNFKETGYQYICPSPTYHFQFRWDSAKHAIICKALGLDALAKNEINKLLNAMHKNGFIPNIIYHKPIKYEIKLKRTRARLSILFERYLFKNKKESNYTQPPLEALAVKEINDEKFTKRVINKIIKAYLYFYKYRDFDKDFLVEIYHPHETGRDADPLFDSLMRFKGLNRYYLIHLLDVYLLNFKYKRLNWDYNKIARNTNFFVEDVMFNVFYVVGIYSIARLLKKLRKNYKKYHKIAENAENAIYQLMWDKKDGLFYALDRYNKKIKIKSVSCLFPLLLPNISKDKVDALIKTIKKYFLTPYPLSSIAKTEKEFRPGWNFFYSIWRGPVWVDMNYFIIKGLEFQYRRFKNKKIKLLSEYLAKKTKEMIRKNNPNYFRECYDAFNGKGLRMKNFGWSCLGALL